MHALASENSTGIWLHLWANSWAWQYCVGPPVDQGVVSQGGKKVGGGEGTIAISAYSDSDVCLYFKDLLRLPASSKRYTHEKCGFMGMQSKYEGTGLDSRRVLKLNP